MVRKSLLVLLLLLVAASMVQAQEVGNLIVFANGRLWALQDGSEQAQPLDSCMTPERQPMEGNLVLSPDGTKIAFRAQPEIVTDAIERSGGIGGGELPSNIWLCDLQTGTLTEIASQPEDASFFAEDGTPDNIIVHGLPSWSPDGTKLTWTQYPSYEAPMQLVTYDLATNESAIIVPELPLQYGVTTTVNVQWGEPGIAFVNYEIGEGNQPLLSVNVYDPASGEIVGQLEFPEGYGMGAGEGIESVFWADDGGTQVLGVVFFDGHFEAFAPAADTSERVNGLEQFSLTAAEGALSLVYAPFQVENIWAVRDGDTFTMLPPTELYELSHLAISPAGDAVAYVDVDNQVYVWRGDMATPLAMPEPVEPFSTVSLAWGPQGWRTFREDVPDLGISDEPITCPGFMVSRLVVGERGVVSDNLPNNVRQEPSASSSRIGTIPSGAEFLVLAGPMCAEDLAWWQVDYNGLIGWTAEGQGDEYWLAPLS